jgi:hypothetical protein
LINFYKKGENMNSTELKQVIVDYNISQGWSIDDKTLQETLSESKVLYKENMGDHRWWTEWFKVIEISGFLIGYTWASSTGDTGIWDLGWEFDWDSLCEVEPKEVTQIIYVKK